MIQTITYEVWNSSKEWFPEEIVSVELYYKQWNANTMYWKGSSTSENSELLSFYVKHNTEANHPIWIHIPHSWKETIKLTFGSLKFETELKTFCNK